MLENKNWEGKYKITVRNSKTKEVIKEDVIYNRILDGALDEIAKALYDGSNDCIIKYLGLGTQTASVLNTTTALGSETFRTYRSSITISNTGEVKTIFFVADTEAKFNIKEVGIFAGASASATIGTGRLMSTIEWIYDKSSVTEEIQITRYDSFNRSTKIR